MSQSGGEDQVKKLLNNLERVDLSDKPGKLEDLNLTQKEVERLETCMKDPEFMKLFSDYVEEISDPKNREEYNQYLKQLEEEGQPGLDSYEIIHPQKAFCIRAYNRSGNKVFVNVCTADKGIDAPVATPGKQGIQDIGTYWELPFLMAAPHKERGKDKEFHQCYDIIVHPDTVKHSLANHRVMAILIETALDGINEKHDEGLDLKNFKVLNKSNYKGGVPVAQRIKKKEDTASKDKKPAKTNSETTAKGKSTSTTSAHAPNQTAAAKPAEKSAKMPKYKVVHRGLYDISEFTEARDATRGTGRPKELVYTIELPKAKSVGDIELDTTESILELTMGSIYHLKTAFPYPVQQDNGSAKWLKSTKQLVVTLPVQPAPPPVLEDYRPFVADNVEDEECEGKDDVNPDQIIQNKAQAEAEKPLESQQETLQGFEPPKVSEISNIGSETCMGDIIPASNLEKDGDSCSSGSYVCVEADEGKQAEEPEIDWRQNPSHTTLVARMEGMLPSKSTCSIEENQVTFHIETAKHAFDCKAVLHASIIPAQSRWSASDANVVAVLKKAKGGIKWGSGTESWEVMSTPLMDHQAHGTVDKENNCSQSDAGTMQPTSSTDDAHGLAQEVNSDDEDEDGVEIAKPLATSQEQAPAAAATAVAETAEQAAERMRKAASIVGSQMMSDLVFELD